jgi:hypothetical protein
MCCGQRTAATPTPTPAEPTITWIVKDATGSQVAVKTSEIAAKLNAARIGGTVEKRVTSAP